MIVVAVIVDGMIGGIRGMSIASMHLAVMLDPLFTYIGGGYTVGRFRGRTDTIWVVHLGRL